MWVMPFFALFKSLVSDERYKTRTKLNLLCIMTATSPIFFWLVEYILK